MIGKGVNPSAKARSMKIKKDSLNTGQPRRSREWGSSDRSMEKKI